MSKIGLTAGTDAAQQANAPAAEAPSSSTVFAELSWQAWLVLDENGRRTVRDPANANHRIEIIDVESGNRRELPLDGAKLVFVGSLGDWR